MSESQVVRLETDGDIGIIIVNYPPVNALGPGVSEGIIACLAQGNADPAVKVMVLMGDGRSFIAGADIRGFGTGRKRLPIGERTYDKLDASAKPVVAAIYGYALGAGWRTHSPATIALRSPARRLDCPRCRSASCPVVAARNACRG